MAMIVLANGIEPSVGGDEQWSYVTHSSVIGSSDLLKVPEAISEGIVVFVGGDTRSNPSSLGECSVVAIDTDSVERGNQDRPTQTKENSDLPSSGIMWPDKDDKIVGAKTSSADGRSADRSRNPWKRLMSLGNQPSASRFSCGAVVIGGETGPIAILNGRVVRTGVTLGGFVVSRIVQQGVVLERSSALYMVPEGRSAIITLPED